MINLIERLMLRLSSAIWRRRWSNRAAERARINGYWKD